MLINKPQLFSANADKDLVELCLNDMPVLNTSALFGKNIALATTDWWDEWLNKSLPKETLQKIIRSAMEKKDNLPSTARFIYRNLTDDDKELFYKRALGLHEQQSINLASLNPRVAEHIANGDILEAHRTLIDDLNIVSSAGINGGDTPWEKLHRLIIRMPMTERMENDFHALILQSRRILLSENIPLSKQSQTVNNITNELFYEKIWENGSTNIVREVHSEFVDELRIKKTNGTPPADLKSIYCEYFCYLCKALVNPNTDSQTRAAMLDDLLSVEYGEVGNATLISIMKSTLLPDSHIHRVAHLACNKFPDGNEARHLLTEGQKEHMAIFLKDERLHERERKQLMRYCQPISPVYAFSPDAGRDGLNAEIANALDKCTDGLFGSSQNEIAAIFNGNDTTMIAKKKGCLTKHANQLSTLINSGLLDDEAMDRLANIFVQSRVPSVIAMMAKNKNLPASSLLIAHEASKSFPAERMSEYNIISVMTSLLTVYLNQHTPPAHIIRENIMTYMGGNMLRAHDFGGSAFNLNTPTSMHSLIATMEYQPGDAFTMLGMLLQGEPKKDDIEVMVNLAMTREIYPAILKGDKLDLVKVADLLALAVQNCQLDEFDVKLLARISNSAQFLALANQLLSNPDFSLHHQQANETLMAEVLKRKVDSCSVQAMGIHRQRTVL